MLLLTKHLCTVFVFTLQCYALPFKMTCGKTENVLKYYCFIAWPVAGCSRFRAGALFCLPLKIFYPVYVFLLLRLFCRFSEYFGEVHLWWVASSLLIFNFVSICILCVFYMLHSGLQSCHHGCFSL